MSVVRCADCGGLTVHAGPISLRVDERSFDALVDVLVRARGALATRAPLRALQ